MPAEGMKDESRQGSGRRRVNGDPRDVGALLRRRLLSLLAVVLAFGEGLILI